MNDLRLRYRVSDDGIREIAGRVLGPSDYDVLLTGGGPVRLRQPDNKPLCIYLPGALTGAATPEVYAVLHSLKQFTTSNRGLASGSKRLRRGGADTPASRTESVPIASVILGSMDPMGQQRYCRLSAWTGRHLPEWATLHPFLRQIGQHLATHVPDRYAAQMSRVLASDPEWIIPGTPFSTVTVNNTYPTGVHTDKGDLDEGFSTIACLRRGTYTGGQLVFPAFRVAVDLADGDLILMDAHQWHGNVPITCTCGTVLRGPCETCGAERISVVSYFRTKITQCADPRTEQLKAANQSDARNTRGYTAATHTGIPATAQPADGITESAGWCKPS